ncbi:MAG: hypothetical protein ACXWLG_08665 [Myxococcaceae bacterium]
MKIRLLITTALLVSASARATDVNASVSVGSADFYGRIEIGTAAKPPVVSPIPVVVTPATVAVERPPIYLRVPPGHAKHWSKHCREYGACGERVFFVEERWYNEVYLPSRQMPRQQTAEQPGHGHGHGHGNGHKDG